MAYVDDLLIVSNGAKEIVRVKRELLRDFKIHELGEVKDFLGCQVNVTEGANCSRSVSFLRLIH